MVTSKYVCMRLLWYSLRELKIVCIKLVSLVTVLFRLSILHSKLQILIRLQLCQITY